MLDQILDAAPAILGWLGTAGTLSAYALLNRSRVDASSRLYLLLNAVGGVFAAAAGVLYEAWPTVASNGIWAAFALHGLVIAMRRSATSIPVTRTPTPLVVPDDTSSLLVIPGAKPDVVVVPDDTSALEIIPAAVVRRGASALTS